MSSQTIILGTGRSGTAAAQWLLAKGQKVLLLGEHPPQEDLLSFYGGTDQQDLEGLKAQSLLLSPGVAPTHPLCLQATKASIPILSETQMALSFLRAQYPNTQLAGITGTNGKSTAVSLATHLLKAKGHEAFAAGNIGLPLSRLLLDWEQAPPKKPFIILELSSYQLESFTQPLQLDLAAWTSFSPDHLERHATLARYFEAKSRIFLGARHRLALPEVLVWAQKLHQPIQAKTAKDTTDLALKTAALLGGHTLAELLAHQETFRGLKHRQELLEVKNRTVINDSKATNLAATLWALQQAQAQQRPYLWIGGGVPKEGESFDALLASPLSHLQGFLGFGPLGAKLFEKLKERLPCRYEKTLKMALSQHLPFFCKSHPSLDLWFSPGGASFDEFQNFEERGNFFCRWIQTHSHLVER